MADASTELPLTRASVEAAHKLIEPYIHKTPVLTNSTLNRIASTPQTAAALEGTEYAGRTPATPVIRFWFKCENLQKIGAFKARGAFHAIERLKREPGWASDGGQAKGVVTHSSGNHAQALALAAQLSSLPAHIIMPSTSIPTKIAAVRGYGAHVTFSGPTAPEREAVTARVQAATGARLIPPYDHAHIVLGQGTAGLELQAQFQALCPSPEKEEQRHLDAVITPLGGGGLLSGTALAFSTSPTAVFGAEPTFEGANDGQRGLALGTRVEAVKSMTFADGLRTPVGEIPWGIIYETKLVRGVYGVGEDEIRRAMKLVWERMKIGMLPGPFGNHKTDIPKQSSSPAQW
jgi:threonine dehydratase